MRLMFIIKGLVVRGGGAERVFVELVNGFAERGHDISVVTFDHPGEATFYELDDRISQIFLEVGHPGVSTSRLIFPRLIAQARKVINMIKPDTVVAFMHSTYVPIAFSMIGLKIPLIISEHIDQAHFRGRTLQRWAKNLAFRLGTVKTVPSEPVRLEHRKKDLHRVVTMPNPVNIDAAGTAGRGIARESTILSVGRFMHQKDFPTLIQAFARIAPLYPDWRLRILGDGDLRSEIEQFVAYSGAADQIELPGFVRNISEEYARASIFALPSRYESFGLVTAEALAAGCPAVGFSDCLGTAYLIQDGINGLLLPGDCDRVEGLASALAGLIDNREFRDELGKNGPASVRHFAPQAIVDRWEELCRLVSQRQLSFEGDSQWLRQISINA